MKPRSNLFGSQSQAEIDHIKLQSSSTLGSGRAYTHADRLAIAEDHEVRRAVGKRKRGSLLRSAEGNEDYASEEEAQGRQRPKLSEDRSGEDADDTEWGGIDTEATGNSPAATPGQSARPSSAGPSTSVYGQIGGALQRNPDGTIVAPRVIKRKAKVSVARRVSTHLLERTDRETEIGISKARSQVGGGR